MSKLQIIIIAVFVVAILVAVLIFSGVLPGFGGKGGIGGKAPEVSVWGTFPETKIRNLISEFNNVNESSFQIKYSEKRAAQYENEIINALASGQGPDIWILTQDLVLRNKDKVYPLPLEYYKERNFRDNFIDSAELFVDRQNSTITGLPLAIDPIVLFWNRDLFAAAGISQPPKYWDEFLIDVEKLVKRDEAGNIIQAGAALGEFVNLKNAKEILSMFILQTGNPIIKSNTLKVVFDKTGTSLLNPTENTIRFFNEFSNPSKSSYTWNRSLSDSDKMFMAGSLAMYFGYASEVENIKQKNPHLNFDVTQVPQIRDSKTKATFGKIYSLVVSKSSRQIQGAAGAILAMTNKDFSQKFSELLGFGSARRDVLAEEKSDPRLAIVYQSSIIAKAWLEPDPEKVSDIFKNMIESTVTGRVKISEAVRNAQNKLEELIK